MAYARGDVEEATEELQQAHSQNPHDLRVQVLLKALAKESGNEWEDPIPSPDDHFSNLNFPKQLVKLTLERNPEIQQRIYQIIAARADWREARLKFTPEFFSLTRFYPGGFFVRMTQDIVGGLIQRPLLMSQAEAKILVALSQYSQTRAAVLKQVLDTYLDIVEGQAMVSLIESSLEITREHVRITKVLVESGLLPNTKLMNARGRGLDLQEELKQWQGRISIAHYALHTFVDAPPTTTIALKEEALEIPILANREHTISRATKARPEVFEAHARMSEAQIRKEGVKWQLPQFNLRTTYGETDDDGRGDFLDGFSIGLGVEFPLLLWPLQQARSDREQAFIRTLELQLAREKHAIGLQTITAYEQITANQSAWKARRAEAVTRNTEWQVLTHRLHAGSEGTQLDLSRAHLGYLESQRKSLNQYFQLQRSTVAFHQILGENLQALPFKKNSEAHDVPSLSAALTPQAPQRGLWVWNVKPLRNKKEQDFLLSFLKARSVQDLFLFTPQEWLQPQASSLQEFLKKSHMAGIHVHALNGEPAWVQPESRQEAKTFLNSLQAYQQRVSPEEQFDALHLDVEPHALPGWSTDEQPRLATQYLDFLKWVKTQIPSDQLPLIVDTPYWFDRINIEETSLLARVWDLADQVVFMAYRNSPQKVLKSLQEEFRLHAQNPKPFWVGISAEPQFWPTHQPVDRSRERTFEHMLQVVENQAGTVNDSIRVAIHDFQHYQDLILSISNGKDSLGQQIGQKEDSQSWHIATAPLLTGSPSDHQAKKVRP